MMRKSVNIFTSSGFLASMLAGAVCSGASASPSSNDESDQPVTAQPKSGTQAKPRLVIQTKAAQPGKTLNLGIHFELDKGWHLYWPGQNDAGLPIQVNLKLPEGWKAGAIQWPAPQRHIDEGDILDHVYFNRVTLIVPVEVPSSEQPGAARAITAELDWLVCDKVCEKGSAVSRIDVPIIAPGVPGEQGKDAGLFETARKSLPNALPTDGRITATIKDGRLKIAVRDAKSLAFYPHESSTRLRNPIQEAVGEQGTLDIELKEATPEQPAVVGVLEVSATKKGNPSEFYAIHVPVLKTQTASPQPQTPQSGKP